LQADEIRALKIVAMFEAKTRIEELLREHLDGEIALAAFETALERDFNHIGVSMAEKHILGLDAIEFLFLLLTLLDIAMEFTIFGNGMTPKLTTATRLLANLELDAFLLFILR